MKSRLSILGALAAGVLVVFGLTLQLGYGSGDPEQAGQKPRSRNQEAREKRRAERNKLELPGPGKHLAFDVRRRDYEKTTRYVLEIMDPSGKVTTQDLQKPKLQRRTILVPIPHLKPGSYKLVVIAENPLGSTRSEPLPFVVPPGE